MTISSLLYFLKVPTFIPPSPLPHYHLMTSIHEFRKKIDTGALLRHATEINTCSRIGKRRKMDWAEEEVKL